MFTQNFKITKQIKTPIKVIHSSGLENCRSKLMQVKKWKQRAREHQIFECFLNKFIGVDPEGLPQSVYSFVILNKWGSPRFKFYRRSSKFSFWLNKIWQCHCATYKKLFSNFFFVSLKSLSLKSSLLFIRQVASWLGFDPRSRGAPN